MCRIRISFGKCSLKESDNTSYATSQSFNGFVSEILLSINLGINSSKALRISEIQRKGNFSINKFFKF